MRLFGGIAYYIVLGIMLSTMLGATMQQIVICWIVIAVMNGMRRQ